jgi:hypothetical protein
MAPIQEENYSMALSYAKLDDNHVAVILTTLYTYTIDYQLLNDVAPIIASAHLTSTNTVEM